MRIGVLGHVFVNWQGGITFISLVANALVEASNENQTHVFLPLRDPNNDNTESVAAKLLDFSLPQKQVTLHIIHPGEQALRHALQLADVDVVIPVFAPIHRILTVPWVGYLYDFQHRCLPNNFSKTEVMRRDAEFAEMTTFARAVVVNSKHTESQLRLFFPDSRTRVFALPFTPFLDPGWVLRQDGIERPPSPYFVICNQFWIHKDHRTALLAFSQIAKENPDVALVCSGNTHDWRAPGYFKELKDMMDTLGISTRVKICGHLPRPEQIELMRNSLAVIQPTLFEGAPGGGSVYEAVALGVSCGIAPLAVELGR